MTRLQPVMGQLDYLVCEHYNTVQLVLLLFFHELCFHFVISTNTYGSHKNRPFKDESHKGSAETMDGEEKKDASKEDLDQDGGECVICVCVCLKCVFSLWNLTLPIVSLSCLVLQ